MKRLIAIDLNFTWPPDGGAPVDLFYILSMLAKSMEVELIIPRITKIHAVLKRPWPLSRTKFFLRGFVSDISELPFSIKYLDFDLRSFDPKTVALRLKEVVDKIKPDHVFIADGWYFKPEIVTALYEYRPFLRLYAHEMICIKGNGLLYRHGRVCDVDFLDPKSSSWKTCVKCAVGFYLTYPSPRWIFEFIRSGAYRHVYQIKCRDAFKSASKIIVGNKFIASRIQKHINNPVIAIPHGVDTTRFVPSARSKLSEIKRFLITGRTEMKNKGLSVVLEASRRLWQKRKDFRIVVASSSKLPNFEFIEKQPWVTHEKVHETYQACDVLLVPSLWPDPFPIVVLEAMACGLPIIGSNVGGIPDQIEDGISGILCEPGNVQSFIIAMERMLDDEKSYNDMSTNARQRAIQFDIDKVFERYYGDFFYV